MDAIRFTLKSKKLQLEKIPIPKVEKPDEVLIKVAYSGICGTDLHIMQGEFPVTSEKPLTLGHEYSGIVVDLGSEVTNFKCGDRVAVDPNDGCHCCHFCRSGNFHHCQDIRAGTRNKIGTFRDGGWAEYAVAIQRQVHRLPEAISLQQLISFFVSAALTEPLSCLVHGWDIVSPLTVGQRILVLGAGIMGNLWVCALHHQGHRNVTVSEPNPTRRNLLRRLETGYKLVTPDDLERNRNSPEYLFDVVVDCSGHPQAIEKAADFLQRGGTLCCFGVAPIRAEIKIKPFDVYMKEMRICGVRVNPYSFPNAIGIMEAMGERYLDYEKLGVRTFSLSEYREAIEMLKKGDIAKAVFEF